MNLKKLVSLMLLTSAIIFMVSCYSGDEMITNKNQEQRYQYIYGKRFHFVTDSILSPINFANTDGVCIYNFFSTKKVHDKTVPIFIDEITVTNSDPAVTAWVTAYYGFGTASISNDNLSVNGDGEGDMNRIQRLNVSIVGNEFYNIYDSRVRLKKLLGFTHAGTLVGTQSRTFLLPVDVNVNVLDFPFKLEYNSNPFGQYYNAIFLHFNFSGAAVINPDINVRGFY